MESWRVSDALTKTGRPPDPTAIAVFVTSTVKVAVPTRLGGNEKDIASIGLTFSSGTRRDLNSNFDHRQKRLNSSSFPPNLKKPSN
jgi:hypothetical protein